MPSWLLAHENSKSLPGHEAVEIIPPSKDALPLLVVAAQRFCGLLCPFISRGIEHNPAHHDNKSSLEGAAVSRDKNEKGTFAHKTFSHLSCSIAILLLSEAVIRGGHEDKDGVSCQFRARGCLLFLVSDWRQKTSTATFLFLFLWGSGLAVVREREIWFTINPITYMHNPFQP